MKQISPLIVLSLVLAPVSGRAAEAQDSWRDFKFTESVETALASISSKSLEGHLSFIASDVLEGRGTPSRGQEIAAHYIAAQFRRAGLKPVGDDGYFQTANWELSSPDPKGMSLSVKTAGGMIELSGKNLSPGQTGKIELKDRPIHVLDILDDQAMESLADQDLKGKIVLREAIEYSLFERARRQELFMKERALNRSMAELGVEAILVIDRQGRQQGRAARPQLIDPAMPYPRTGNQGGVPQIIVHSRELGELYDRAIGNAQAGIDLSASLSVGGPVVKPVKLRNVIGVLEGSDPELRDTYVMVTAHYDHLGIRQNMPEGEDNIFNGANDDGSGTVSVIELASALSKMKVRPRRSIIFMCVFGEERGLLGSRYYGRNPILPIEKTVADINLEQVGRTDSSEGEQLHNASMTGYDFSDVGEIFTEAGRLTGVEVYKHEVNSDKYFGRSDNQALADKGVPAHTICVAFSYDDYHGAGDHWEKIDYENMAEVNRMVAVGILMIANDPTEPKWNEENPKTRRYVEAWRERRGLGEEIEEGNRQ